MKKLILIALSLTTFMISSANAAPTSFSNAKKILAKDIYTDRDETFYCGCDMYYVEKKGKPWLTPSHDACGFEPRKQEKRAARIEWEHVVPAWYFGHQRMCWQEGGRKQCGKTDKIFKAMEADLHNLVPAIGEVNGDRSNYSLTMVSSNISPQYGQCDMKVDFKGKKAQPTESVRGDIARVYFYMADTYGLRLSSQDLKIYTAWHNADPVSGEEKRVHDLKARFQGKSNPFVTGKKTPKDYKYTGQVKETTSTDTNGFMQKVEAAASNFVNGEEMFKKAKKVMEQEFEL